MIIIFKLYKDKYVVRHAMGQQHRRGPSGGQEEVESAPEIIRADNPDRKECALMK